MRWIVRVAVLALLATVGMKLRDRQVELAALAGDVGVEREGIVHAEAYVDDLDARIDDAAERLQELDARVSAIEARYRTGIPAAARAEYEQVVARRNEVSAEYNHLVDRRRSAVQEYEHGVARHNAHVEDANALAGESTPWRILQGLWQSVAGRPDE